MFTQVVKIYEKCFLIISPNSPNQSIRTGWTPKTQYMHSSYTTFRSQCVVFTFLLDNGRHMINPAFIFV